MPLSNLTAYTAILENSAATPGLFDRRFQTADANIRAVDTNLSVLSTTVSTISGGVLKSYANASARDAAIPSPSVDQVIAQKDTGYFYRRDQSTSTWVPEALTRAAGPVVSAQSHRLVGDGTTDDAPFLSASDLAATAGKGRVEIDPVTAQVMVKSDLQISNHFRPAKGCNIYVAAGVTLTINAEFDPGYYQVFDPTSPGTILFTKVRKFYADWFGVKGDGATDDAPALNFMTRMIPDYSTVWFESFMTIIIKSEWLSSARRQVRYVSNAHPHPDGNGTSIIWAGPPPQLGTNNNATITNGSQVITFAHALSRVPQPGERFLCRGPQTPNLNALVIADAGNSTTQVKVDTAAQTPGGTPFVTMNWTLGGVMIALASCDHCEIAGFAIHPHLITNNQVRQGWGGYIASGTNVLNNASTDGNASFNGRNGQMIRVVGAGPSGTDLITTILAVNSDNQCTLNANASTTILSTALTRYDIGQNGTTLPALWGIMLDLTGVNGVTGTNCFVTKNLITAGLNYGFNAIGISLTSQDNQELHEIVGNTISLGGPGGLIRDFFAKCTTVAGNTTVQTDVANLIPSARIGMRIRIPGVGSSSFTQASINNGNNDLNVLEHVFTPLSVGQSITVHGAGVAGADLVTTISQFITPSEVHLTVSASTSVTGQTGSAGGGVLDTYVISVPDNQHFVVRDAPAVSASGKVPTIGDCLNPAIEIGASFNAKKIRIEFNIISNVKYGVWLRNGSFQACGNQFENGEMAYCLDGSSTPSSSIHDDHEGVLRFFGVSDINFGTAYPVSFTDTRMGSLNMICQGGHLMTGQTSGPIHLSVLGFDTMPDNAESQFFEHHGGQWTVEDCSFPNHYQGSGQLTVMSQIIDTTYLLSLGGRFKGRNWKDVSDVPAFEFFYARDVPGAGLFMLQQKNAGEAHCIDVSMSNRDDSTDPISTIRARLDGGGGGPSQELAAIDAGIGQTADSSGNGFDGIDGTAVIARMPIAANWKNTFGGKHVRGIHVVAPGPANNVTNPLIAVHVEEMANSGIADPRGIWSEGTNTPNLLAGTTFLYTQSLMTTGTALRPGYAFSSESSLGFYRSGASTLAPSYGTLNLATNAVRLSMRTQGSLDSTNLAVNEVAFSILGASGATLAIRSSGTIWYFNSSASTKG